MRLLVYVVLAALIAAAADWITRRLARRGDCALHRGLILPDACVGKCPPGRRCVAFVTRRHWLFGRQAAGCGCVEARFGGSPVAPPDFADPPRRIDRDPPPPSEPKRQDEDA